MRKSRWLRVLRMSRFIAPFVLLALWVAACDRNTTGPATPGALTTLALTPDSTILAVGGTQQFAVVGTDANGNEVSITPTWSVMNGGGTISSSGQFTAGTQSGTFANTVKATSGSVSDSASVTVSAGGLTTLVITPITATMAVGGTHQFTVKGTDAAGNEVVISPDWLATSGSGTINTSGLFTAGTEAGTFPSAIRVSSGSVVSDYAAVTITPGPLTAIAVTPNPDTLIAGGSRQFAAEGKDAHGNAVSITPTWSVTAGGGSISSSGQFTAGTQAGTFANTVQATSGSVSGNATVTVTSSGSGPLATIAVAPSPVILAAGGTQQFVAEGKDVNGNAVLISPTWSVTAGGGSISSAGLFTAGTQTGTFSNTVTAISGSISGNATVSVSTGALASISITPDPTPPIAAGGTQQFAAVGKDVNGNEITLSPAWSVVAGGGQIDAISGLFTAGAVGGTYTNTVRATIGGFEAFVSVTVVTGPLATIALTPNSVTLVAGGTQQFVAEGKDADGNVVSVTPTWSVVSGGGSINSTGLFTAGAQAGTFPLTVVATSGSVSGAATVTVTASGPGPLATIAVTPNPDTLAAGGSRQFVAEGKDADGNAVSIAPTWLVVSGGGSINSTGLFTAGAQAGTFPLTVVATSGSVSGAATVTVTASGPGPLATIAVTPNPDTLAAGGTQQFVAEGKDADGNVVSITPTWSVANGGGSINSTGLFTAGTQAGTFTNTVTATSGSVSGAATVTVTASVPGPLATIVVAPNPDTLAAGGSRQFVAEGKDADGNVVSITPTWSVTSGGSISLSGLFTAGTQAGTFTNAVRATSGLISGTATVTVTVSLTGPPIVNLGTAGNFAILAKSAISTTGTSSVVGDIGVSPAAASFITGFSLSSPPTTFTTSPLVTGQVFAADYNPPTPANLTTAVSDMETAYTDAAGRTLPDFTELGAGNIDGLILVPGLYKWGTGVSIPSGVTLSGDANAVWIFQIAQDLTVGNGAIVTLNGGAQAKNIFWQVAGQATLGTTADFKGIILSQTLISFNTGAVITGRALAQTAVTLNATAVTNP